MERKERKRIEKGHVKRSKRKRRCRNGGENKLGEVVRLEEEEERGGL